jgi:pilin isopeptide linkage protein
VNTYSIDDSKTAVIEVSKTLKGRDWKTGDKFSFTLEAMTDGAPMPWFLGRTASVTKNKTQDGFGKITYKNAGTWKYAVREKDSSIKGITTDSTVKYVTVTVADNGDGTLKTPVVTYDNSYSVNSDDAAVKDKAAFTNTYKDGGKGTNTGDSTSIMIELVTAVCAAALLTVMLIRKRREKNCKQ